MEARIYYGIPRTRKLRRNDVVAEKSRYTSADSAFFPGRVWKRADADHVMVIDVGYHITTYHEDDLILTNYTGMWLKKGYPGWNRSTRWIPMTSLRYLKKRTFRYHESLRRRRERSE